MRAPPATGRGRQDPTAVTDPVVTGEDSANTATAFKHFKHGAEGQLLRRPQLGAKFLHCVRPPSTAEELPVGQFKLEKIAH